MPGANVIRVLEQIAAMSTDERQELWTLIPEPLDRRDANGKPAKASSSYDHTPRLKWLEEHASEYAGQYIALDGDRLIAHGADSEEVFTALRALRPPVPYFGYIPAVDAPPLLGANLTL